MVAWSSTALKKGIKQGTILRRLLLDSKYGANAKVINFVPLRSSGHETLPIRSSHYQWAKFKDTVNFYTIIGLLTFGSVVAYVNIFIGPATLEVIPEGYEPKPWEYYEHPITRFFARYFYRSPQEVHERNCHGIYVQCEKQRIGQLERSIFDLMEERQDYQAWYFFKPETRYIRQSKEYIEKGRFEVEGKGMSYIHT